MMSFLKLKQPDEVKPMAPRQRLKTAFWIIFWAGTFGIAAGACHLGFRLMSNLIK